MKTFHSILAAAGDQADGVLAAAAALKELNPCAEVDSFHFSGPKQGDVLDELLDHASATRADLLVVGAHKHTIASRATMLAPCSVLMVPAGTRLRFSSILVPVDFSESSADALRAADALASAAGGDWTAVTVECTDDPWLDWEQDHMKMRERLEEFTASAVGRRVPGKCLVEAIERSPASVATASDIEGTEIATTILQVAARENSSLLVLGTRGRTRSAAMLLGSVAEHVMRLAPCPVLAVKRPGKQMGALEAVWERLRHPEPSLIAN